MDNCSRAYGQPSPHLRRAHSHAHDNSMQDISGQFEPRNCRGQQGHIWDDRDFQPLPHKASSNHQTYLPPPPPLPPQREFGDNWHTSPVHSQYMQGERRCQADMQKIQTTSSEQISDRPLKRGSGSSKAPLSNSHIFRERRTLNSAPVFDSTAERQTYRKGRCNLHTPATSPPGSNIELTAHLPPPFPVNKAAFSRPNRQAYGHTNSRNGTYRKEHADGMDHTPFHDGSHNYSSSNDAHISFPISDDPSLANNAHRDRTPKRARLKDPSDHVNSSFEQTKNMYINGTGRDSPSTRSQYAGGRIEKKGERSRRNFGNRSREPKIDVSGRKNTEQWPPHIQGTRDISEAQPTSCPPLPSLDKSRSTTCHPKLIGGPALPPHLQRSASHMPEINTSNVDSTRPSIASEGSAGVAELPCLQLNGAAADKSTRASHLLSADDGSAKGRQEVTSTSMEPRYRSASSNTPAHQHAGIFSDKRISQRATDAASEQRSAGYGRVSDRCLPTSRDRSESRKRGRSPGSRRASSLERGRSPRGRHLDSRREDNTDVRRREKERACTPVDRRALPAYVSKGSTQDAQLPTKKGARHKFAPKYLIDLPHYDRRPQEVDLASLACRSSSIVWLPRELCPLPAQSVGDELCRSPGRPEASVAISCSSLSAHKQLASPTICTRHDHARMDDLAQDHFMRANRSTRLASDLTDTVKDRTGKESGLILQILDTHHLQQSEDHAKIRTVVESTQRPNSPDEREEAFTSVPSSHMGVESMEGVAKRDADCTDQAKPHRHKGSVKLPNHPENLTDLMVCATPSTSDQHWSQNSVLLSSGPRNEPLTISTANAKAVPLELNDHATPTQEQHSKCFIASSPQQPTIACVQKAYKFGYRESSKQCKADPALLSEQVALSCAPPIAKGFESASAEAHNMPDLQTPANVPSSDITEAELGSTKKLCHDPAFHERTDVCADNLCSGCALETSKSIAPSSNQQLGLFVEAAVSAAHSSEGRPPPCMYNQSCTENPIQLAATAACNQLCPSDKISPCQSIATSGNEYPAQSPANITTITSCPSDNQPSLHSHHQSGTQHPTQLPVIDAATFCPSIAASGNEYPAQSAANITTITSCPSDNQPSLHSHHQSGTQHPTQLPVTDAATFCPSNNQPSPSFHPQVGMEGPVLLASVAAPSSCPSDNHLSPSSSQHISPQHSAQPATAAVDIKTSRPSNIQTSPCCNHQIIAREELESATSVGVKLAVEVPCASSVHVSTETSLAKVNGEPPCGPNTTINLGVKEPLQLPASIPPVLTAILETETNLSEDISRLIASGATPLPIEGNHRDMYKASKLPQENLACSSTLQPACTVPHDQVPSLPLQQQQAAQPQQHHGQQCVDQRESEFAIAMVRQANELHAKEESGSRSHDLDLVTAFGAECEFSSATLCPIPAEAGLVSEKPLAKKPQTLSPVYPSMLCPSHTPNTTPVMSMPLTTGPKAGTMPGVLTCPLSAYPSHVAEVTPATAMLTSQRVPDASAQNLASSTLDYPTKPYTSSTQEFTPSKALLLTQCLPFASTQNVGHDFLAVPAVRSASPKITTGEEMLVSQNILNISSRNLAADIAVCPTSINNHTMQSLNPPLVNDYTERQDPQAAGHMGGGAAAFNVATAIVTPRAELSPFSTVPSPLFPFSNTAWNEPDPLELPPFEQMLDAEMREEGTGTVCEAPGSAGANSAAASAPSPPLAPCLGTQPSMPNGVTSSCTSRFTGGGVQNRPERYSQDIHPGTPENISSTVFIQSEAAFDAPHASHVTEEARKMMPQMHCGELGAPAGFGSAPLFLDLDDRDLERKLLACLHDEEPQYTLGDNCPRISPKMEGAWGQAYRNSAAPQLCRHPDLGAPAAKMGQGGPNVYGTQHMNSKLFTALLQYNGGGGTSSATSDPYFVRVEPHRSRSQGSVEHAHAPAPLIPARHGNLCSKSSGSVTDQPPLQVQQQPQAAYRVSRGDVFGLDETKTEQALSMDGRDSTMRMSPYGYYPHPSHVQTRNPYYGYPPFYGSAAPRMYGMRGGSESGGAGPHVASVSSEPLAAHASLACTDAELLADVMSLYLTHDDVMTWAVNGVLINAGPGFFVGVTGADKGGQLAMADGDECEEVAQIERAFCSAASGTLMCGLLVSVGPANSYHVPLSALSNVPPKRSSVAAWFASGGWLPRGTTAALRARRASLRQSIGT